MIHDLSLRAARTRRVDVSAFVTREVGCRRYSRSVVPQGAKYLQAREACLSWIDTVDIADTGKKKAMAPIRTSEVRRLMRPNGMGTRTLNLTWKVPLETQGHSEVPKDEYIPHSW